ncbi:GTPase IMAP family member 9-like [Biomphalaria glabrata]|uniref:GTPase IMAP family member 9-like n=1 Tax=Biomphalaria glabrata TaxID=6526 RepID=A0A9W2Z3T2_BIOGL|nr:GTPase IMAP family member 9-like [Biomphalaria glabrata]XP_055869726.1 GTPase IMAP family member 9-like [Biomphalaria glabrata]
MKRVNFLLLGTSGNGISSLGNTLLGRTCFKTSSDLHATENIAVKGSALRGDCRITVVDISGIDTDNKSLDPLQNLKSLIQIALNYCEDGFTAIVFVLQFCGRYTRQEQETLKLIKATLGEDVIAKNTVCVFTHGDLYKHETESFITWCRSQKGNIQNVLAECNYRCLLFNNKTEDVRNQDAQLKELLKLATESERYTLSQFQSAEKERKSLEEEILSPIIAQEASMFVSDMQTKLKSLEDEWTGSNKDKLDLLSKYQEELLKFEGELVNKNLKPGNYVNPFGSIKVLKVNIQTKRKLAESEIKLESLNDRFETQHHWFIRNSSTRATCPARSSTIQTTENFPQETKSFKRQNDGRRSLREENVRSYNLQKARGKGNDQSKDTKRCIVL